MPSDTSRPANPTVISVTTKPPVGEPNQAAPDGLLNVAHSGWKNSEASTGRRWAPTATG